MRSEGRYHVLGGTLSALDGIGPEDLNIPELIGAQPISEVREVILALSATVDGQTTAHYIAEKLGELKFLSQDWHTVSQLAANWIILMMG